MNKCKKCGKNYPALMFFRFDKGIYLPKHFQIQKADEEDIKKEVMRTSEIINEWDNKIICQSCLNHLKEMIAIDDYKIRNCEHLNIKGAHVPHVTILNG